QDPYYYFDETLGMSDKSVNDNEEIFTFNSSGGTDDYEAAEKYVNLIASKCNLKVTTDYYDQKTSLFFSWGLTYTGSGRITQKGSVNYTNEEGNVTMWGLVKRSSFKFVIAIPSQFEIVDLGYRYSGNNVSSGLYGQSAAAGLYKNSDGSFSTSDGRLTTSLGNATVLRDGTKYTGEVRVDAASKDYRTDYWVEDYYRDEVLIFGAPTGRLMTGDIYTLDDLTIDTSSGSFSKAKDLTGWTWTTFLGIGHSDKFFVPTYKTDYVKNLTLRVMYYEKDVAMVYYICAEFNSEPYVVEALCAADLSNVKEYTGAAGEYDLSVGQTVDITCPTVFSTKFEVFTWEATSGSDLVSLSGTVGQTCTVKALSPGTARVKVTYEYSKYYNDSLTDIVRVDPYASSTYEYIINIS
ncbi:MAG: hypothetical protein LIO44_01280, partial [Eubacterium sp.]|nr:hypothetical protein [Eubacterium sp.]